MLLSLLSERFRAIAFDTGGAGRSSVTADPYTTPEMAGETAALLNHLGIKRAHVISLSMGGLVAQEVVLMHPERVDRLELYATYARRRPAIHSPWFMNWVDAYEREIPAEQHAVMMLPWFLMPAFMVHP